jgi:hypothetical protein
LIATFYAVASHKRVLLRCGIEREKNSHRKLTSTIRRKQNATHQH